MALFPSRTSQREDNLDMRFLLSSASLREGVADRRLPGKKVQTVELRVWFTIYGRLFRQLHTARSDLFLGEKLKHSSRAKEKQPSAFEIGNGPRLNLRAQPLHRWPAFLRKYNLQ